MFNMDTTGLDRTDARRVREISEATAFDAGDPFESEEQVRAYFTQANLREIFGADTDVLSAGDLSAMAEDVIASEWYCNFGAKASTGTCILAHSRAGHYQIETGAEVEDWSDVRADSARVERIEDLTGWSPYTAAYRVYPIDDELPALTYFVAE